MKTIIFLLLFKIIYANDKSKAIKYLSDYGYLDITNVNDNTHVSDDAFREALMLYQLTYNLEISGELSDDTLNFMNMPRCGVKDEFGSYRTSLYKWNKQHIKWHYKGATKKVLQLTDAAFKIWQDKIDIQFKHDSNNPDILITNKRRKHKFEIDKSIHCSKDLDGKGNVLGHAFFPDMNNNPVEIHMDDDEIWYLEMNTNTPKGQTNVFEVLIHEIGHSLGLRHSDDYGSIMYAYYNGSHLELSQDDIDAIQSLYGKQSTQPTQVPIKPISPPIQSEPISLCQTKHIDHILFMNGILYVFYQKWVWIIQNTIPQSQLITDWLTFLPNDVNRIDGIYQRPSGELVIFSNNMIYMIHLHTLQLISGYPKPLSSTGLRNNFKLNGIVNTYSGRTFIFFNDFFYAEIDECNFKYKVRGIISREYSGLPTGINSVFRYINGMLYFFRDDAFYEYNEFTKKVVKYGIFDLSLFGIDCIKSSSLISELIIVLNNTIQQLKHFSSI
ncbi:collagenase 3-like [Schistocerca nitens]|uniref:collagenase 3-like n=1 Tax=Schistocerca nitens TaxID=7011 RepID=UPI0021183B02|nr:collagenase 3-like [Schistocerca nitens]